MRKSSALAADNDPIKATSAMACRAHIPVSFNRVSFS
jgi:hypothetical protein